ncbi:hypothetical protein F4801DRAFT_534742 [Xylaria longipes]|nr:hypothetical protein F4801DRAFT_534742 [Xylaria longipes]
MTFAPFGALCSGSNQSSASKYSPFHLNLIGHMPPLVLYKALRGRRYGAALSNIATVIGSILTVALAGLWVVEQVAFPTNVEILPATNWDLRWNNSLDDDGGAAIALNNIEHGGSDVPDGIWKDLVFPDLNISTLSNGLNGSTPDHAKSAFLSMLTNFTFDIPALRPALTCEAIHSDIFADGFDNVPPSLVHISATYSLPTGCHAAINTWVPTLCGVCNGERKVVEMYDSLMADNPDGCPSIAIVVGSFTSSAIVNDNVTVLVCSQKIQRVQTHVTLRLGNTGRVGRTSLLSDPVVDESTVEYLTNGTDGVDSFNYRIEKNLLHYLDLFTGNENNPFFNFLLGGPGGAAFDDLIGAKNVGRLISAVNTLYNKYMVNVVNSPIFRKNSSDTQGPQQERIYGSTDVIVSRLTVDYKSKLALQIMLGLMVVLGGLGVYLADMRGILPRKPYSIASVMALLAGSKLCTRDCFPEGAEFMHQDQLLDGPLKGASIRLGWWDIQTESQVAVNESSDSEDNMVRQRFGIDVGEPITLGFRGRN